MWRHKHRKMNFNFLTSSYTSYPSLLKFQTLISICTFNFILFTSLGTGSTYPQLFNSSSTSVYNSHLVSSRQLLQPSPSYYYRNIYRNRNYYNKLMSSMTTTTEDSNRRDLSSSDEHVHDEQEGDIDNDNHSFNKYPTTPSYSKQDLYNVYNQHYHQQQQQRYPTSSVPKSPHVNYYDHLTTIPPTTTTTERSTESSIVFLPSAQTPEIVDTSASAYIRSSNNYIDLGGNNVIVPIGPTMKMHTYNKGSGGAGQNSIPLPPPDCSSNLGYCEEVDQDEKLKYPKTIINSLLQKLPFTPSEFKQIYGETNDNSTQTTDLKLLERTGLGNNFDESPLCSSIEHTIYPRVARNKDNKWMYIVNHDEYIQGVRVEKCLDEGQPCIFSDTFSPPGFVTTCRQKYIYKKLLALSPEGRTQTDSFKLPSCCVCYVKRMDSKNNGFTRTKSSNSDSDSRTSTTTNTPARLSSTTPGTISPSNGQMVFNDESNKPIITGTTTTSDL